MSDLEVSFFKIISITDEWSVCISEQKHIDHAYCITKRTQAKITRK